MTGEEWGSGGGGVHFWKKVGAGRQKEGSDCSGAWIGSNDSREPMMLLRRRRPNKQADWQQAGGDSGGGVVVVGVGVGGK